MNFEAMNLSIYFCQSHVALRLLLLCYYIVIYLISCQQTLPLIRCCWFHSIIASREMNTSAELNGWNKFNLNGEEFEFLFKFNCILLLNLMQHKPTHSSTDSNWPKWKQINWERIHRICSIWKHLYKQKKIALHRTLILCKHWCISNYFHLKTNNGWCVHTVG